MRGRLARPHPRLRFAGERDGELRCGTGHGRARCGRLRVGDRAGEVAGEDALPGAQVQHGRFHRRSAGGVLKRDVELRDRLLDVVHDLDEQLPRRGADG